MGLVLSEPCEGLSDLTYLTSQTVHHRLIINSTSLEISIYIDTDSKIGWCVAVNGGFYNLGNYT